MPVGMFREFCRRRNPSDRGAEKDMFGKEREMSFCGEKPCCHVRGIARAAIKIRRAWGEDRPDNALAGQFQSRVPYGGKEAESLLPWEL